MSGNNIFPQSIPSPIQPSQQQAGTSALFPTPAQAVSRLQSQEAPTQSMRMQPEESVPPEEAQDLQPDEVLDSYPEEPIPPKEAQDLQPDEVPDSYPEEPIPPFQAKPNVSGTQPQASPPGQSPPYRLTSSLDYFQPNGFARDIAAYQAYANCKTGYVSLDNTQPRYPGLYLLGAISSLGKTTNAHQMGDQIAASGESVLYFSLEQNRFELYSKSIARSFFLTQQENNSRYPTPSSIEIRSGIASSKYPNELAEQIERYTKTVGNRMIIIDGIFSMTVEDIENVVTQFITAHKCKPVVIVDYLQIVAPSMSMDGRRKMDTREAVDHIVHRLKALQSQYDLTVIVISSLNRQNYLTPIDFESFKESGGIEYTADVIWGLQLSVMSNELFGREGKIKEKRDMVRKAKLASPRNIDLVCLKNRFGPSSYTVQFNYFPASDTFEPVCTPPIASQGKVKQW